MTLIRGTTQPLTHQAVQVDYYTLMRSGRLPGVVLLNHQCYCENVDEMKEYQE